MKLNLACGANPLPGFVNLGDPWRFQDGLDFDDASAEAITISHALMYLPIGDWPAAFAEFYRVLEPGGVIRITEDHCTHPQSERYGGHEDAITLTSPRIVKIHLRDAWFTEVNDMPPPFTLYLDLSLIQQHHGAHPKVFHVEGRKPHDG